MPLCNLVVLYLSVDLTAADQVDGPRGAYAERNWQASL